MITVDSFFVWGFLLCCLLLLSAGSSGSLMAGKACRHDKRLGLSSSFLVAPYRPYIENRSKTAQHEKLHGQFGKRAAFKVDQPHDFDEIFQRIGSGYHLRPSGHARHRSKQSAHQNENHHEKIHHEHGLAHGFGIIGYD